MEKRQNGTPPPPPPPPPLPGQPPRLAAGGPRSYLSSQAGDGQQGAEQRESFPDLQEKERREGEGGELGANGAGAAKLPARQTTTLPPPRLSSPCCERLAVAAGQEEFVEAPSPAPARSGRGRFFPPPPTHTPLHPDPPARGSTPRPDPQPPTSAPGAGSSPARREGTAPSRTTAAAPRRCLRSSRRRRAPQRPMGGWGGRARRFLKAEGRSGDSARGPLARQSARGGGGGVATSHRPASHPRPGRRRVRGDPPTHTLWQKKGGN